MDTLLHRMGGEPAVSAAVELFYDRVFSDPLLVPFFAATDKDAQRKRQKAFLIRLMDGKAADPEGYMRNAHKKYVHEMGMTDAHFDAVAGHLVAVLTGLGVAQALIDEAAGALLGLRNAVLDR